MATKDTLIGYFANGQLATGPHFQELIETMKVEQDPVSDSDIPTSGISTTFLAALSQDANGKIAAVKKTVNFNGYQPVSRMARYQELDVQITGKVDVDGSGGDITTEVVHNKGHYPTVRLIDGNGTEVRPSRDVPEPYVVNHGSVNNLDIILIGDLNVPGVEYNYILD